ncbi:hypothetical protein [Butyrivibrio fibrisolvens]|uniref:hypothetical protein n=1 Tax=Butyrivibrio fibrisolvens TaxID=831 RepID=UPI00042A8313|nr:hypothetical protein [Butyrivibrio fibrisolvens]
MILKSSLKSIISVAIIVASSVCMLMNPIAKITTCAAVTTINPNGILYELDEDSKYDISTSTSSSDIQTSTTYGSFFIKGDMKAINAVNGFASYEVAEGNISLNYTIGSTYSNSSSTDWHIYNDKTKKINGEDVDNNILSGGVVLQTSLDGNDWITDKYISDIAVSADYNSEFYTTKNIQQVNGCYYRIIIVYELEKQIEDGSFLLVNYDQYEYKKYAEVYTFYLINSTDNINNGTSSSSTPKKNLGSLTNTGKDNGYSGNNEIKNDDPHYGWEIGQFFVNGYTREAQDAVNGTPVFLKNVGDRVTLWFNLQQDITCLNGKSNLQISEDVNGYDQYFQTEKSNVKRGMLIIRYTDYEGVKHDPVIYTDYLAANARTGADTKVELFEEGDYEVALDYEILDNSGIDSYTNYRLSFTFAIRNGNCMVFPFDIITKAELQDKAITENGFKLDMAKSRYLTIDVKRSVLVEGTDGRTEDVRFNRPAKDGDEYKDEGIYTFTVKNTYTNETTTKTIYVGTDPFLKALSLNGLTVNELESKLDDGYTISFLYNSKCR